MSSWTKPAVSARKTGSHRPAPKQGAKAAESSRFVQERAPPQGRTEEASRSWTNVGDSVSVREVPPKKL